MSPSQDAGLAWQIEAHTYPKMRFDDYRNSLIYETKQIRDFLTETRGEHFIISAPKGFGKTLLLIAKRKQIEEIRGYHIPENQQDLRPTSDPVAPTGGGEIVDRPRGSFPALSQTRIASLEKDYLFWKNIWAICIMIAAIKLDARTSGRSPTAQEEQCDPWIKEKLLNEKFFNSPTILFTTLVEADYTTQLRVIESARSLNFLFDAIRTPIAFFIDNVDEYFNPIVGDRALDSSRPQKGFYRGTSNELWTVAQLALAGTAYAIHKTNAHVKVYCTIRREALIELDRYDNDYNQILGCTVEIEYKRDDFQEIFHKNIRLMEAENLVTGGQDLMVSFFGPACSQMKHRFVDQNEGAFDFVLRHTFYRPRDLMMIGRAIELIPPQRRTPQKIQEAVDGTTDDLVKGLVAEMSAFFYLPDLRELLALVETNVMTVEQLEEVTAAYKKKIKIEDPPEAGERLEFRHPFCVLQKIGMIGWIQTDHGDELKTRQRFIQPREITMRNQIGLPHTEEFYLLHPALDRMASERAGSRFFRKFHRANIIGNELAWLEPSASLFVVKGDICGFSEVMASEFYRAVVRRIYEWAESACSELDFFEVSGGDSIMMIDKSADRIVRSVASLLERAREHTEVPLTFRFGGSAGPIAFQEFNRRINGNWQKMVYPTGLALRNSARLEPHASPGSLIVDDRFMKLRERYANQFKTAELDESTVNTLVFDKGKRVFLVRKNNLDPAYETRIHLVNLAG